MNIDVRKKAKNDFEKDFFKLINNPVFGEITENVRRHGDIKSLTTEGRRNYLASESNYNSTIFSENFFRKSISNRNKKNKTNIHE